MQQNSHFAEMLRALEEAEASYQGVADNALAVRQKPSYFHVVAEGTHRGA